MNIIFYIIIFFIAQIHADVGSAYTDEGTTNLGKFFNQVINGKVLAPHELEELNQIASAPGATFAQACEKLQKENLALARAQLEALERQYNADIPFTPAQQDELTCICKNSDLGIQHICKRLEVTPPPQEVGVTIKEQKKPAPKGNVVIETVPGEPDPLTQPEAYRKYVMSLPQWQMLAQDEHFIQHDPIPGQVNAFNKNGEPIYPVDIDYMKKINQELFRKNPEIKKNYKKLIAENACPGCNLRGVQFKGRWFYKKDPKTGKFTAADLRGADLTDANFDSARLGGADFRGAICNNTTFNYAALSGANFRGTNFARQEPIGLKIKYDNQKTQRFDRTAFSYTTAIRTIFDDCDFTNVDFSVAILAGSSFKRCEMRGASFLFLTDLSNCTFEGAKHFIEDRWKQPEIYLSTGANVDSRRSPIKAIKPGTNKETVTGSDYMVIDRLVKFYNTTFPDGRKFPNDYNMTPGLGTSDIFRKIPTIQTK